MTPLRLPAAVLSATDPGAASAARLVPLGAKIARVGEAVLGYEAGGRKKAKIGKVDGLRAQRVQETTSIVVMIAGPRGVDTDDGETFLEFVAHHAADGEEARKWARRWTPRLTTGEVEVIIAEALASPRRWTAEEAGEHFRLTAAERDKLGIRTMRGIGQTKTDLDAARRRKDATWHREHRQAERAARPPKPDAEPKPWTALGISRRTWFRRRKEWH